MRNRTRTASALPLEERVFGSCHWHVNGGEEASTATLIQVRSGDLDADAEDFMDAMTDAESYGFQSPCESPRVLADADGTLVYALVRPQGSAARRMAVVKNFCGNA